MVSRRRQYIASHQIWESDCRDGLHQDKIHLTFRADVNLKVKFTFSAIKLYKGLNPNETEDIAYIADGSHSNISIPLSNKREEAEIVTEFNEVTLVLPQVWENKAFVVGFQGQ